MADVTRTRFNGSPSLSPRCYVLDHIRLPGCEMRRGKHLKKIRSRDSKFDALELMCSGPFRADIAKYDQINFFLPAQIVPSVGVVGMEKPVLAYPLLVEAVI
jgi:hypothetical protein